MQEWIDLDEANLTDINDLKDIIKEMRERVERQESMISTLCMVNDVMTNNIRLLSEGLTKCLA